jgi:predicted HicB family RNase H-like nuclease
VAKTKGDPYRRQRPHLVGVRLSDEEHALVVAAAKRQGVSAASVLRYTFLATYAADPPGQQPGTEEGT